METQIEYTDLSMRSVIWSKLIYIVREYTILDLFKYSLYLFTIFLMCSVTVDNGQLVQRIVDWKNGTIPHTIVILISAYYAPRFFRLVLSELVTTCESLAEVTDFNRSCSDSPIIEGMDTEEVIEHLITRSTFKREEIEAKFKVPRYRYSALVKKLKELGVLVTGENNMSVFNSENWNRQRLEELLYGKEMASELKEEVKIVRKIPSSTPLFTQRPVSCATQCATPRAPRVQKTCTPCAA